MRWIVVLEPNERYQAMTCGPFLSEEKAQRIAGFMRPALPGSSIYVAPLLPVSRWDDLGESPKV